MKINRKNPLSKQSKRAKMLKYYSDISIEITVQTGFIISYLYLSDTNENDMIFLINP